MDSKYSSSALYKIFSFGIVQHGVKIKKGNLVSFHNWFPVKIKISEIIQISYIKTQNQSYSYKFRTKREVLDIPYSTISGSNFQLLIKSLLELNSEIEISSKIKTFIGTPIEEVKFKLDFTPIKLSRFTEEDLKLTQNHSDKDAAIGFSIVFIFILGIGLSYFLGDLFLTNKYGENYPSLNIGLFLISGFLIPISISNIIIALVSMYLGHKLTLISFFIGIIFLVTGVLL